MDEKKWAWKPSPTICPDKNAFCQGFLTNAPSTQMLSTKLTALEQKSVKKLFLKACIVLVPLKKIVA